MKFENNKAIKDDNEKETTVICQIVNSKGYPTVQKAIYRPEGYFYETYQISANNSVSGNTEVSASSTPIFSDTRADTSLYTAGDINETLDQPTTINNYYLHRINGSDNTFVEPVFIDSGDNIKEYAEADFESLMQEWIRYTAVSSGDGYSISYNIGASGSGNTRGSGMADTRLNGSGNYQTRYVNTDDYRAQEFPNGTATTITTYYLRISKS